MSRNRYRRAALPVSAITRGAAAGVAGTAAMDLLWYSRYKRGGGEQALMSWEFAEGLETWDQASAPGQVGKQVFEKLLGSELPDRRARITTNFVHWATGLGWGALYGIAAGSKRRHWAGGLFFGFVAWLASYAILGPLKLYKPIWEYDAKSLGQDLSAHLVFGAVTGAAYAKS